MRNINEKDFVSFTISNGWNFTVFAWKDALKKWGEMNAGTLYGNKSDGSRAIIDQKQSL